MKTGSADGLQATSFLVDPETRRGADEPTAVATRLLWIFTELLRYRAVHAIAYHEAFGTGERTLQRDLAKLRKIGPQCGFTLTPRRAGHVRLAALKGVRDTPFDGSRALTALVREVATALGGPIASALAVPAADSATDESPFLRVVAPRLVETSEVGRTFATLEVAAKSLARVEFDYVAGTPKRPRRDAPSSRMQSSCARAGVTWLGTT
jgi:predicted DNA-binding transcriptional regulator YafY